MQKVALIVLFILFFSLGAQAKRAITYEQNWDYILKNFTKAGRKEGINTTLVKYQQIKKSKTWETLIEQLKNFNTDTLKTKEQQLAFWVNIYNIAVVKMVVDNYPLRSIKEKSTFFKSVWDHHGIAVGQRTYLLRDIKNILLKEHDDPRIFFVIVDASLSAPDLRQEAYTERYLETQLNAQVLQFLNNEGKGLAIDHQNSILRISRIFKQYNKEFKDVRNFIIRHYNRKHEVILNKSYPIEYLPYKWELNEL